MQAESISIAYFGKIPVHGDFVRHNAHGAAVRAMDTWLQQALGYTQTRGPNGFKEDLTYPFLFDPGHTETVLVGVMQPSHDSVGRSYPFLMGIEVDARALNARRVAHVPVLYEAFWDRAGALAHTAAAGQLDRHDLIAQADALGTHVSSRMTTAPYQRYLQQTALTFFWERLWGYAGDSRKYLLFKHLLDILLPLRSGIPPGFSLVLRFPLPPDGRLPAFDASVWVDVCMRLLGLPTLQPSFFWTLPDTNTSAPPFLLLTLRPPQARTLAYLLEAEPDGDTLCHLETRGAMSAAHAALSIPARYGKLLEAEDLSIGDFLQRLRG